MLKLGLLLTLALPAGQIHAQTPQPDSAAVVAAVERYHLLLQKGDTTGAAALLTPDAIVLESGDMETRQEYLEHHLKSDMAFARAVSSPSRVRSVKVLGDMAWVASTNRATGTFNGRRIDSDGAELMVLRRVGNSWMIDAIHWSSRRRNPG